MIHSQSFFKQNIQPTISLWLQGIINSITPKTNIPTAQKKRLLRWAPTQNDTFSPHARAFEPPRVPVHGSIVPFASASWVDESGELLAPPRERKIWTAASSHGMFFLGACQQQRERKVGIKKSILIFMKGTLLTFTIHDFGCLYRYLEVFMMYAINCTSFLYICRWSLRTKWIKNNLF